MNFNGNGSNGGGFKQPKPGLVAARIYRIADLGTQDDSYQGKPKRARKMMVWWELAQKMDDGQPYSVFLEYSQFLTEKAKLRKHMESWAGKAMDEKAIKDFNPKTYMLGKACMVNLVQKENGKVVVEGLLPVPEGMPKPAPHNPQVYFDLDSFDRAAFEALPDWIKNKIMLSPEYLEATGQAAAGDRHEDGPPPESDDEIPF